MICECLCLPGLPKDRENIIGIFEFVQLRKEIFVKSFISEDRIGHRSHAHNLSSCEIKALNNFRPKRGSNL